MEVKRWLLLIVGKAVKWNDQFWFHNVHVFTTIDDCWFWILPCGNLQDIFYFISTLTIYIRIMVRVTITNICYGHIFYYFICHIISTLIIWHVVVDYMAKPEMDPIRHGFVTHILFPQPLLVRKHIASIVEVWSEIWNAYNYITITYFDTGNSLFSNEALTFFQTFPNDCVHIVLFIFMEGVNQIISFHAW